MTKKDANNSEKRTRAAAAAVLAGLVIAATAYAVVLALNAEIPRQLPGIALGSTDLYRQELGLAHMIGFYIVILLIALAADGKGLVKFGKDGAEFGDVIGQKVEAQSDASEGIAASLHEQERVGAGNAKAIEAVRQAFREKARADKQQIAELTAKVQNLEEEGRSYERRIAALEEG